MSEATYGTTAPVVNTPASEGIKDRLSAILDKASHQHVEAQYLAMEAAELFSDLKEIAEEAGDNFKAIVDNALDSASWLDRACENVQGEFDTLIDCLNEAVEA
jgi:hypothetical protein